MGGGGGIPCDEGLRNTIDLQNCHCQPLLDLLCKFHHLDADIVYGAHTAEEIHHCDRPADAKGSKYKIIHCGCLPTTECQKCEHDSKKACMARKTHAISLRKVTAALHIDFVSVERFIKNAVIEMEFNKPCPKNSGYYHMQTADFGCMASLRVQMEEWGVKGDFQNISQVFVDSDKRLQDLELKLFDAKNKNEQLTNTINKIEKALHK